MTTCTIIVLLALAVILAIVAGFFWGQSDVQYERHIMAKQTGGQAYHPELNTRYNPRRK